MDPVSGSSRRVRTTEKEKRRLLDPSSDSGRALRGIIVIGASAGGVEALLQLAAGLPEELKAAVLVVLHLPPNAVSNLPELVTHAGKLRAEYARDGEPLVAGRIYIAPPDRHLLIQRKEGGRGFARLSTGPRENHARPAIDTMFRSAALAYGPRVIGVILSGMLSDGTAGSWEIKERHGISVVQDPGEALCPSMPHTVLDQVPVDHVLPVAEIPALLTKLTHELPHDEPRNTTQSREGGEGMFPNDESNPDELPGTAEVRRDMGTQIAGKRDRAVTVYVCPDCGGTLWQVNAGTFPRFRCHIGHVYGAEDLLEGYTTDLEQSLWRVVRTLQDKANLARQLAAQARERGDAATADEYEAKARRDDEHMAVVERMTAEAPATNRPG